MISGLNKIASGCRVCGWFRGQGLKLVTPQGWGLGFRVQGLGFGLVWGLGSEVWGSRSEVGGVACGV